MPGPGAAVGGQRDILLPWSSPSTGKQYEEVAIGLELSLSHPGANVPWDRVTGTVPFGLRGFPLAHEVRGSWSAQASCVPTCLCMRVAEPGASLVLHLDSAEGTDSVALP